MTHDDTGTGAGPEDDAAFLERLHRRRIPWDYPKEKYLTLELPKANYDRLMYLASNVPEPAQLDRVRMTMQDEFDNIKLYPAILMTFAAAIRALKGVFK